MHAICCGSGLYSVRSAQCKPLQSIVSACQVITCWETEQLKGLGKSVTAGEHMMAMSWNLSGPEKWCKRMRTFSDFSPLTIFHSSQVCKLLLHCSVSK